jgi:RHS repeat-associated protein
LRATVPRWQGMSGGVRYVWDAENRLRAVIPAIPVAGQDRKVEYGYDYLGRRVIRRTYDWDGQALAWTGPVEVTKYVYNGWRVIMELDGLAGDIPTRKFSWGLDLSAQAGQVNSLESAGGIGGLLAAEDSAGTGTKEFIYFADANGNIGQVVETTAGASYGTVAAHYEYAPFGKRINTASPTEYDQPYRFSSKPFDSDAGLGYWGYRHYSPELGRWISRDPIGERGGANLYAYVANSAIDRIDGHGLKPKCERTNKLHKGPWTKAWHVIFASTESTPVGSGTGLLPAGHITALDAYEKAVWLRDVRRIYKCEIGCSCVYVGGSPGREGVVTISDAGVGAAAEGIFMDPGGAVGKLVSELKGFGALTSTLIEESENEILNLQIQILSNWVGAVQNPAPEPSPETSGKVLKKSDLRNSMFRERKKVDCTPPALYSKTLFIFGEGRPKHVRLDQAL